MRGRGALPCQCPKWLSVPSASRLGSGTTGTAGGSRLNRITVSQEKIQARRESTSIQMNVFISAAPTRDLRRPWWIRPSPCRNWDSRELSGSLESFTAFIIIKGRMSGRVLWCCLLDNDIWCAIYMLYMCYICYVYVLLCVCVRKQRLLIFFYVCKMTINDFSTFSHKFNCYGTIFSESAAISSAVKGLFTQI